MYVCVKFGYMQGYLSKFHGLRLFSLENAGSIVKGKNSAVKLLANYISKGLVCKVRRNLYGVTNPATGHILADQYEIASAITSSAYISYHSALEYYGLANQVFNTVYVSSESRFNDFEFDGRTYHYCNSNSKTGITAPLMSGKVRVTTLERTVIDCIDRIDRSGGTEELLQSIQAIQYLDEKQLMEILSDYDKATLYKKAGFVLEHYRNQLHLSTNFFDICSKRNNVGSKILTSVEDCPRYDSKWRIYVPEICYAMTQSTDYESV